mmetsp:Transcript_30193/g.48462  ORF Transcript_30193/g.48462 Transcript_30193/m.48462 type:complete len:493 (-) Transcript_30193:296-1774(-)
MKRECVSSVVGSDDKLRERFENMKLKRNKGQRDDNITSVTIKASIAIEGGTVRKKSVPEEWQKALNATFGLPPQLCTNTRVKGYKSPIPTILEDMRSMLRNINGFCSEGIFRLAPDKHHFDKFKEDISSGSQKYRECRNANCIANLIKVWFRDLPVPALHLVDFTQIASCVEKKDRVFASVLLGTLPEPQQSILKWLLDLCVEVTAQSKKNRMTPEALAIVIAPNLYRVPEFDPTDMQSGLAAMKKTKIYSKFWKSLIEWRFEKNKGRPEPGRGSICHSKDDLHPLLPNYVAPSAPRRESKVLLLEKKVDDGQGGKSPSAAATCSGGGGGGGLPSPREKASSSGQEQEDLVLEKEQQQQGRGQESNDVENDAAGDDKKEKSREDDEKQQQRSQSDDEDDDAAAAPNPVAIDDSQTPQLSSPEPSLPPQMDSELEEEGGGILLISDTPDDRVSPLVESSGRRDTGCSSALPAIPSEEPPDLPHEEPPAAPNEQ